MAFPVPLPHRVQVDYRTGDTRDAHGGNVANWSTLAADVPCLITQGSGSLRTTFAQQGLFGRYTVTGIDPALGRSDTRYKVTDGPRAGKYFRVVGVSEHGPVAGVLDTAFYRSVCDEETGGA